MSNVKKKIEVPRRSKFMAKADDLYLQRCAVGRCPERFGYEPPERMNCVLRGVNDQIRKRPYFLQDASLVPDRRQESLARIGRMRAASFGEPPLKSFVRGLEEHNKRLQD